MQKYYKAILIFTLTLVAPLSFQAQTKTSYKDVLLNGREAKLNLATGEFIFEDRNGNDSIVSAKQKNANLAKQQTDYYTVANGDNLLKISKKYGTTINKIKEANNLQTTLVSVGQKLKVKNLEAPGNIKTDEVWLVFKGQTLYHISTNTGVSISDLKRLNNLKNNTLFVGQKLRLK